MKNLKDVELKYKKIESEIPKVCDLESIPIIENNEPLIEISESDGLILSFHNSGEMLDLIGPRMLVRKRVYEMLIEANKELQSNFSSLRVKLFYAYRALEVQTKYYTKSLATAESQFPNKSEEWKKEFAHALAAYPLVAGHPTGGAVDVTLTNIETSKDVDMGVAVFRDAISKAGRKIYMESPEVSEIALKNRLLLRSIMESQGFAPFSGEFWHFSYGDREWASKLEKKHAMYNQISLLELENFLKSTI